MFIVLHVRIERDDMGSRPPHPMESHKWPKVSSKILVRTALAKQLDPLGLFASRGRSVLGALLKFKFSKKLTSSS